MEANKNVREYSPVAASLLVIVVGLLILGNFLQSKMPEGFIADFRALSTEALIYTGSTYYFAVRMAAWLIIISGVACVVFSGARFFRVFKEMIVAPVLSIPMLVCIFIIHPEPFIFTMVALVVSIVGIYWSFKKVVKHARNESVGLFKFFAVIKEGPQFDGRGDARIDKRVAFILSTILAIGEIIVIVITIACVAGRFIG